MIMPRSGFLTALAFVGAIVGGAFFLDALTTQLGIAVAHADTAPIDAAAPAPDAAVKAATAESGSGSGSAIAVGSGSAAIGSASSTTVSTTTTITNADQLHDVLSDPLGAYQDVKTLWTAKKGLGALVVLIFLTRVLARVPGKIGAWFATGVRATVLAGIGSITVAAFDAATTASSWTSVLMTAVAALLALLLPTPAPATNTGTKAT